MQLIPHDHARKHFQKLSSDHEAIPELLIKGLDVQSRPLQISGHSGLPPTGKKNTKHFYINNDLIKNSY